MIPIHDNDNVALTANIAGESYNLNDRSTFFLRAYDGLEVADVSRQSQKGPRQGGDTDLGFNQLSRFPELAWLINGLTLAQYRELRQTLQIIFIPRDNDPVQLVFTFDSSIVRAVDVNVEGRVNFPYADRTQSQQFASAILKASDPRLYIPEQRIVSFQLAQIVGGGLSVPMPVATPIGGGALNQTVTFTYANGDRLAAPEFPIITIYGPISDPVVENLTTGEKIELTNNGGLVVDVGEFVQIDLSGKPRRDSKTIRDQDGNSVSQFLTTDSDLATFHLSPAGEKLPNGSYNDGTNTIRVAGDNANTLTRVDIQYFDRFRGI